jgi:hypothetical protein
MAFAGVANAKDRADLVAYLKSKWESTPHDHLLTKFPPLDRSDFLIIIHKPYNTKPLFYLYPSRLILC